MITSLSITINSPDGKPALEITRYFEDDWWDIMLIGDDGDPIGVVKFDKSELLIAVNRLGEEVL